MLKLAQTDRPTDQQTGQKQYVPHYYRVYSVGGVISLWNIARQTYERYGAPELVAEAMRKKLYDLPYITAKDPKLLFNLLDILTEIERVQQDQKFKPLLAFYNSSAGTFNFCSRDTVRAYVNFGSYRAVQYCHLRALVVYTSIGGGPISQDGCISVGYHLIPCTDGEHGGTRPDLIIHQHVEWRMCFNIGTFNFCSRDTVRAYVNLGSYRAVQYCHLRALVVYTSISGGPTSQDGCISVGYHLIPCTDG
ncbi:hypothetical protein DPMN_080356 [Dreissena polymorpha]|uniref:Uncharacterized protein n=1 Tax=Dreissena polymorpha TaxID=45954 RepID=A0A9D4BRQ1_DREPO|nr:hypothetical protein DPMN_080356 [Dreissena polymorpha]